MIHTLTWVREKDIYDFKEALKDIQFRGLDVWYFTIEKTS